MKHFIVLVWLFSIHWSAAIAQMQYDTIKVFYDINIARTNAQQQKDFEQQWQQLVLQPEYTFLLFGYADYLGNEKGNFKLAANRVNILEQWLLKNGVKPQQILLKEAIGAVPFEGTLSAEGNPEDRRVDIFIRKPVHKNASPAVASSPVTTSVSHLDMEEKFLVKAENETFEVENLSFIPGMHRLMKESIPILEELAEILKNHPAKISIEGHICCLDPRERDGLDIETGHINLSVARAKMVYNYLISKGIPADLLSYKGFGGKHKKITPEHSEEDAQANRRVEIRIIEKY